MKFDLSNGDIRESLLRPWQILRREHVVVSKRVRGDGIGAQNALSDGETYTVRYLERAHVAWMEFPMSCLNPFDTEFAKQHSAYYTIEDEKPILVADSSRPTDLFASAVAGAFRGFVRAPQFPCVGAKSAVMNENYWLGVYSRLGSAEASAGLARDLFTFTEELVGTTDDDFKTFVACFREPTDVNEVAFERLLWTQLQKLNIKDTPFFEWDETISSDPSSPHFAFSFAKNAFFVVGLHPHSSRESRKFPWPCLVFNSHAQFAHLKSAGSWERLQAIIRERDQQLQGSINPNLTDVGTCTEARQYSGRKMESDWHPPFHAMSPDELGLTEPPLNHKRPDDN